MLSANAFNFGDVQFSQCFINPFSSGSLTLPQTSNLDSSKLKEFADDNFKFDTSDKKFSKKLENTGKRRNCSLRAIFPFSTVFSKDLHCRH